MQSDGTVFIFFAAKRRATQVGLIDNVVNKIMEGVQIIQEALKDANFVLIINEEQTFKVGLMLRTSSSHPISIVYSMRKAPYNSHTCSLFISTRYHSY